MSDIEIKEEIIAELRKLECCDRCILHHLNVTDPEQYVCPELYFDKIKKTEENDVKKFKANICRLCLDILQEETLDEIAHAIENSNIADYKTDEFYANISLPKSIFLRKHAISIYLKEEFPAFYNNDFVLETMSKIVRYSINNKLAKQLNKRQSKNANFEININIGYKDDETEVENVCNLDRNKFKPGRSKKAVSRNDIFIILETVKDPVFKSHFCTVPPVPNQKVHLEEVTFVSAPIYIGGRYLKFSRKLAQTPWVVDGKKVVEHSVQDILFDAIEKIIGKQEKMVFSSSGREDVDVRMLGQGRPFYIQIDNPKNRCISREDFKKIECEINSSKLMAVKYMQLVYKSDIAKIKDGEENKKKIYSALCYTNASDVNAIVDLINAKGEVELSQKTPIRVLHRRNLAVRKRMIYEMEAAPVPDKKNLFKLKLVTQAGTYVKEFVHGDFERTVPNIGIITGSECDILALDVLDIELDWPENKLESNATHETKCNIFCT